MRQRFNRRLGAALLVLGLAITAGACASGGPGPQGARDGGAAAPGGGVAAPAPDTAGGGNKPAPGATTGGAGGALAGSAPGTRGGDAPFAPRDEARIVKTGTMSLEVGDVATALAKARTAVVGFGGYVSASEQAAGGERRAASVTYRIPAERWDDALAALRKVGSKVVEERTQAVEVTGQVLDLGARIDNLRASERALQGIMARATRIADILEVQRQLTAVRGEIEQLSTQKAHLEEQAAYGTLTATYLVPVVAVQEQTQTWDLRREVDRATAALVGLGQGLVTLAVWLVILVVPLLLLVGLLLGVAAVVARRLGLDRFRQAGRSAAGGP